jgi:hypothetical protein
MLHVTVDDNDLAGGGADIEVVVTQAQPALIADGMDRILEAVQTERVLSRVLTVTIAARATPPAVAIVDRAMHGEDREPEAEHELEVGVSDLPWDGLCGKG